MHRILFKDKGLEFCLRIKKLRSISAVEFIGRENPDRKHSECPVFAFGYFSYALSPLGVVDFIGRLPR